MMSRKRFFLFSFFFLFIDQTFFFVNCVQEWDSDGVLVDKVNDGISNYLSRLVVKGRNKTKRKRNKLNFTQKHKLQFFTRSLHLMLRLYAISFLIVYVIK